MARELERIADKVTPILVREKFLGKFTELKKRRTLVCPIFRSYSRYNESQFVLLGCVGKFITLRQRDVASSGRAATR